MFVLLSLVLAQRERRARTRARWIVEGEQQSGTGPPGFLVLVSRPRVSMPTRRAVTSAPTFARPLGERIRAKLYLPECGRTKHVQNANSEPFGNALKRFNGLLFAAAPCNALTPTNAFQRIVSNVA